MTSTKEKRHKEIIMTIEKFNPKIKRSLHNTLYQEREDMEQEIKLKIIEKMSTIKFSKAPGFWDILDE